MGTFDGYSLFFYIIVILYKLSIGLYKVKKKGQNNNNILRKSKENENKLIFSKPLFWRHFGGETEKKNMEL